MYTNLSMGVMVGVIMLLWITLLIVIIVCTCRTRSFVFSYHSHTVTVTVKAHRMTLFVDGKFEDEFGGNQVWSATLKATVDGTEIKARVCRRFLSCNVEVYADGEQLPLVGTGK